MTTDHNDTSNHQIDRAVHADDGVLRRLVSAQPAPDIGSDRSLAKRLTQRLLIAAFALVLVACGSGSDTSQDAAETSPTDTDDAAIATPEVTAVATTEPLPDPTATAAPTEPTPTPEPDLEPDPTPAPDPESDALFDLTLLGAPDDLAAAIAQDPAPEDTFGQVGGQGIADPASTIVASQAVIASMTGDQVDARFNNSSFPCNVETEAFTTTCPRGATRITDGEFIIVAVAFEGPVASGDGDYTYALAFDDDGDDSDNFQFVEPYDGDFFRNSEFWYSLHVAADGTRTMWADGNANGLPGIPRFTAAIVIEAGDRIYWVIPRREVPGDVLVYRATGFTDRGPADDPFNPETSGGDFTGPTVLDPLIAIDLTPIPFDNDAAVPPDITSPTKRLEPPSDRDTHARQVLIDEFTERTNDALRTGDLDALSEAMLHPQLRFGPGADRCLQILKDTIAQADTIEFSGLPLETIAGIPIPVFPVLGAVNYPTGTVAWEPMLAIGPQGRLFLLLPECLQ